MQNKKIKISLYILFVISSIVLLVLTLILIREAKSYENYESYLIFINSLMIRRMTFYIIGTSCFSIILSFLSIYFVTSSKFTKEGSLELTIKDNIKKIKKNFQIFFGMGLFQLIFIVICNMFLAPTEISGYVYLIFYPFKLSFFIIHHIMVFTIPSMGYLGALQIKKNFLIKRDSRIPWLAGILALFCIFIIIFGLLFLFSFFSLLIFIFIFIEIALLGLEFMILLLYGYWKKPHISTDIYKDPQEEPTINLPTWKKILKNRLSLKNIGLFIIFGFLVYFMTAWFVIDIMLYGPARRPLVLRALVLNLSIWVGLFIYFLVSKNPSINTRIRLILYLLIGVLNISSDLFIKQLSNFGCLGNGVIFIGFGIMLHFSSIIEEKTENHV